MRLLGISFAGRKLGCVCLFTVRMGDVFHRIVCGVRGGLSVVAFLADTRAVNQAAEANFLSKAQASVDGLAQGAAAFQAQVDGVVSQVVGGVQAFTEPLSSLARPPANLAASVLGGVNAIVASIENTRSAFTLLKQVIDRLQNSRTEGTSSANKAEQAMQSLFITAALGQMASITALPDLLAKQKARLDAAQQAAQGRQR